MSTTSNAPTEYPTMPYPVGPATLVKTRDRAANRVARAIGVVKWVAVVGWTLFATALFATAAMHNGVGALDCLGFVVVLIPGVVVWAIFGWFEHTLDMLAAIARNTGR